MCDLVANSDPSALALLPSILSAFGQTLLTDSNAVEEVKQRVVLCMKELASGKSPLLQQSLGAALGQISDPLIVTAIQTALST